MRRSATTSESMMAASGHCLVTKTDPRDAVVVAADLDRTLIYSHAALAMGRADEVSSEVVCVEHLNGAPLSFMTAQAAAAVRELGRTTTFVPCTTRTREQLARVNLPGAPPRYAIAANGGFLLVDGRECRYWTAHVTAVLAATAAPLDVAWRHLQSVCVPGFTRKVREADGLFCYAVIERDLLPEGFVAELAAWADERGWASSLQGAKLYLVPQALTKGAAVCEIAHRVGASTILAAGDSLLDAGMLEGADRGIRPGHGELAETGWSAAHVIMTPEVGALAGEQIAMWLLQAAAAAIADSQAAGGPQERTGVIVSAGVWQGEGVGQFSTPRVGRPAPPTAEETRTAMALWDQLKQRSQDMNAQLKTKASQFSNKEFANGTMAMCALIAAADGSIDKEERSKVAKLITSNDVLSIFPASELRDRFDHYCDKLTSDYDFGKVEAIQAIAKLKTKQDQARAVIQIGIIIGGADGNFDKDEQAAIREGCHAVGISPSEFDL